MIVKVASQMVENLALSKFGGGGVAAPLCAAAAAHPPFEIMTLPKLIALARQDWQD
jgi:hypothetical protein